MNAAPIDLVLSRLTGVQKGAPGQYRAQCLCCGGRSRKVSVRETPDGAVLIHGFCGCAVSEIVSAMGLQLTDLFPPREKSGREPKRIAKTLTAGQALELLADESNLVAVAAANLAHGTPLTAAERGRLMLAAGRVAAIAREASHA